MANVINKIGTSNSLEPLLDVVDTCAVEELLVPEPLVADTPLVVEDDPPVAIPDDPVPEELVEVAETQVGKLPHAKFVNPPAVITQSK